MGWKCWSGNQVTRGCKVEIIREGKTGFQTQERQGDTVKTKKILASQIVLLSGFRPILSPLGPIATGQFCFGPCARGDGMTSETELFFYIL